MLYANHPKVQHFLTLWHENGRASFKRRYRNLDYDAEAYRKFARDRKKYIALDDGPSGIFLVDRQTEEVWSIKAYGVPKRTLGTLDALIATYTEANEQNRMIHPN